MGGRGAGSSIPTAIPSGGGGASAGFGMDQQPGSPNTLKDALGAKGRPMSAENAVMNANPFYDRSYGEYSENCQRAVVATEARFRGYNVIAQPTYEGDKLPNAAYVNPKTGVRNSFWMGAFKGAKPERVGSTSVAKTQQNLESKMKSYGNGSRAIMQVQWKGGGGHVLNVVQKNGKTYYYDGQIGVKYNASDLFKAIKTTNTQLVRTDNLKFSDRAKKSIMKTPKR